MNGKKGTYKGKLRNAEEKKKVFRQAVSKIMLKKGFGNFGVNAIANEAGISKTLLYRYFGSCRNLLEQYSEAIDFWLNFLDADELAQLPEAERMKVIIMKQFDYLSASPEMQRLVLWGLFESNYNTATLLKKREEIGEHILLKQTDQLFAGKADFRATAAILVAATYHLATYASVQKITFCGINLSEDSGKKRIKEAMSRILDSAFACVKGSV